MREILFRGQTRKNGEKVEMATGEKLPGHWVYGGIFPGTGDYSIIYGGETEKDLERHVVYSETVSQYTGLNDKHGNRIFEGDIVAQNWYDYDEPRDDSFGNVEFCEYDCSFSVMDVNKDGFMPLGRCGSYHWEVDVIGNIHDNPELLEK